MTVPKKPTKPRRAEPEITLRDALAPFPAEHWIHRWGPEQVVVEKIVPKVRKIRPAKAA